MLERQTQQTRENPHLISNFITSFCGMVSLRSVSAVGRDASKLAHKVPIIIDHSLILRDGSRFDSGTDSFCPIFFRTVFVLAEFFHIQQANSINVKPIISLPLLAELFLFSGVSHIFNTQFYQKYIYEKPCPKLSIPIPNKFVIIITPPARSPASLPFRSPPVRQPSSLPQSSLPAHYYPWPPPQRL